MLMIRVYHHTCHYTILERDVDFLPDKTQLVRYHSCTRHQCARNIAPIVTLHLRVTRSSPPRMSVSNGKAFGTARLAR